MQRLQSFGRDRRFWWASPSPAPIAEQVAPAARAPAIFLPLYFRAEIDPSTLSRLDSVAGALAILTALTKIATGYWA